MPVSGKGCRNKGARHERAIKNKFADVMPKDADRVVRGQQYRGGVEAPDVDVAGVLWVECKHYSKRPNIRKALDQATNDCPPKGRIPCAVTKANNDPLGDLITMRLDHFLEIWEGYWAHVNQ